MMFSDLEAVLFDLDGTLIDCSDVICLSFNAALGRHGLRQLPNDSIRQMIGRPLRELFEEQNPRCPVEALIEEYKTVFGRLAPGNSRLIPGARQLVVGLSRRKLLGIVTSRSSAGTTKILEELGLREFFSTLVGVEDVVDTKPSPAPVSFALRNLGVEPSKAVFIGDTPFDIEAGRRAGARTVGVTTGAYGRQQLLAAGARLVLDSLEELETLIDD